MSHHDDDQLEGSTSRRSFLRLLGTGSGALGLGAFGGLVLPRTVLAQQCAPPGNPGKPTPWRRDCRPIRPRRPASSLTAAEVTKLRAAYKAMRDLDTSDPNDPRGFTHQANVHCWYCGEGTQVHFSWQFFAWHRAYLYFHERILGKLIGDMEFRLPYWSWEVASHRRIPPAYSTPANNTNPLWKSGRAMSATDAIPEEDVGAEVMEAALTADDFTEFGGDEDDNGIPEIAPHGSVHVDVGGDMGFFDTAARDPVFYAHHSNVDKMWSDWNSASSTHTNPTSSDFLNLSWNFYDENRQWRSITAAQVLNHENQLRYTYGRSIFSEILPCLLDWIVIRTDWRASRTLKLADDGPQRLTRALQTGGRARLHIRDLEVPLDKSAVYRVYANPEAARPAVEPGSEGYLGNFAVVLNNREGRHIHRRTRNMVFSISGRKLDFLARAQQGPSQLVFVERGAREGTRRVMPVAARDVFLTAAGIER
jgi:polyphenol oxidase